MRNLWLILIFLVGGAVVSVATGALPSHADAVFLGLIGSGLAYFLLWSVFCRFFDRTNGNDTGLIVAMLGLVVFIVCAVGCPLLVLLAGTDAMTTFVVGVIVMGAYTVFASYSMT